MVLLLLSRADLRGGRKTPELGERYPGENGAPRRRRTMICPKCREEIPDHSQSCPLCRAEIYSPENRKLKTSGLAIASLVLSLTCIFAIVALPLAIAAQIQISRRKHELTGSGLAIAAMCISGVSMFMVLPILLATMLPVFFRGPTRPARRPPAWGIPRT